MTPYLLSRRSRWLSLQSILFLSLIANLSSSLFFGYEIREFEADGTLFDKDASSWTISGGGSSYTSTCGTFKLLGGFGIFNQLYSFSKEYTGLPPHSSIHYSISLFLIDSWNLDDYCAIQFDSNPEIRLGGISYGSFTSNICGTNINDLSFMVHGVLSHSSNNLRVRLRAGGLENEYLGFRRFSIVFRSDPSILSITQCVDTSVVFSGFPRCPTFSCNAACKSCFGSNDDSKCYECSENYFFDGSRCLPCHTSCSRCHGTNNDKCDVCKPGYSIFAGYGCIPASECSSPLKADGKDDYENNKCVYPCDLSQYLHSNGSCTSSCRSPLQKHNARYNRNFCVRPCGTNEFPYYNGTCTSSCLLPFVKNYYDVAGVLQDTHIAPSSSQIYYPLCESPCFDNSKYIFWNKTCSNNCPLPLTSSSYDALKLCNPPLCGNHYCLSCNSTNDCSDSLYCDLSAGGFCVPRLVVELIKSITNGYIFKAQVKPTAHIITPADEKLILSLLGYQNEKDYKVQVINIELGIFKVTLELLKPADQELLPVQFTYSPQRLLLTQTLNVSKPVFLSEELVKAVNTVTTASDSGLIIMIVSAIGFMVLGKLSTVLSFVMLNQYMHHLLYLNVDYLTHTKFYLQSLKNYNIVFSKSKSSNEDLFLLEKVRRSLPKRFFEENFPVNSITNAGQILAIIFGMLFILTLTNMVIAKRTVPPRIFLKVRKILMWNGIIKQILVSSLPLIIAALVQIHASIFGKDNELYSVIPAFASTMILLFFFRKMYNVVEDIPRDSFSRSIYIELYSTLWQGLTLKSHRRFYYWILMLRGLFLAYFCVVFDLFPFVQLGALILIQFYIIGLYFGEKKTVFQDRILNTVSLIEECLLLLMKLLILSFSIAKEIIIDDKIFILLGWLIMAPGLLLQSLQALYAIYLQIKNWRKIWGSIYEKCRALCGNPRRRRINKIKKLEINSRIKPHYIN